MIMSKSSHQHGPIKSTLFNNKLNHEVSCSYAEKLVSWSLRAKLVLCCLMQKSWRAGPYEVSWSYAVLYRKPSKLVLKS